MINQVIEAVQKVHDYDRLQETVLHLFEENEKLRLENAKLRQENRILRRRLKDRELRLLRRAEADALLIGALYFAHQYTSRRACVGCGISERRWMRAIALIRVARLYEDAQIIALTPEDFERRIDGARQWVEQKGMDTLRYRMPFCRQ